MRSLRRSPSRSAASTCALSPPVALSALSARSSARIALSSASIVRALSRASNFLASAKSAWSCLSSSDPVEALSSGTLGATAAALPSRCGGTCWRCGGTCWRGSGIGSRAPRRCLVARRACCPRRAACIRTAAASSSASSLASCSSSRCDRASRRPS